MNPKSEHTDEREYQEWLKDAHNHRYYYNCLWHRKFGYKCLDVAHTPFFSAQVSRFSKFSNKEILYCLGDFGSYFFDTLYLPRCIDTVLYTLYPNSKIVKTTLGLKTKTHKWDVYLEKGEGWQPPNFELIFQKLEVWGILLTTAFYMDSGNQWGVTGAMPEFDVTFPLTYISIEVEMETDSDVD